MKYILTDEPKKEDIGALLDLLREYNLSRIECKEVKPLAIFIKDDDGCIAGGISATTHGNWLEVSYLCVAEALRGQNIGSKLLKDAEEEAVKRGCKYSFLDTFGFQAKGFYLKRGYKEVFTKEEYPLTGTRHYLLKQLTEK